MAKKIACSQPNSYSFLSKTRTKSTPKLKAFEADLLDDSKRLVFASGLPFTGKTATAMYCGIMRVCEEAYRKLIIIRPALDNAYGFLPGGNEEKMQFLLRQAKEYANEYAQGGWITMQQQGLVEAYPADQLQGIRFAESFVIIDEAQNISRKETFKTLSRIGGGGKIIVLGDISKGQENKRVKEDSLLHYCIDKFSTGNDEAPIRPEIGIHSFYEESDLLGDDFTKFLITHLMSDFL